MNDRFSQPSDASDLQVAFGLKVLDLMPEYSTIPEEFCNFNRREKWGQLVTTWFFRGLKTASFTPKEGIDAEKALRHIRAIMCSFEPKHEHKQAACAYLLSLWFDDVTYEAAQ